MMTNTKNYFLFKIVFGAIIPIACKSCKTTWHFLPPKRFLALSHTHCGTTPGSDHWIILPCSRSLHWQNNSNASVP